MIDEVATEFTGDPVRFVFSSWGEGAVLEDLCLVGMEACATAHYWARELSALGHEVRLMPAQYVKGTSNNSTPGGETSNQIQGTHEI